MKKNKILIIENKPDTFTYIKPILENFGYKTVEQVSPGNKTIISLDNQKPDAIIINFENKITTDIIKITRTINDKYNIPIVFILEKITEEILEKLNFINNFNYILKPVNEANLTSTIYLINYKQNTSLNQTKPMQDINSLLYNIQDAFVLIKVNNSKKFKSSIIEVNQQFIEIINRSKEKIIGKCISDIFPASLNWEIIYENTISKKNSKSFKILFKKSKTWGQVSIFSPQKDYIALIIKNITHQEKIIRAIKESEEKFRNIAQAAQDAIIMIDYNGNVSFWNKMASEIFGYSKEEIVGQNLHKKLTPEHLFADHKKNFTHWQQTGKGNAIDQTIEIQALKKDRTIINVELSLSSVQIKNKWHAIGVVRDITKQKTIQNELIKKDYDITKAHQDVQNLLSSIKSILIGVSITDTVTHWNETAELTFGLKANEIIGKKLTELNLSWEWIKIYEGIMDTVINQKAVYMPDIMYINQQQEKRFLGISINPIMENKKVTTGFLIYGRDITEKKTMEMELLQSQKLKSIGELASGIAHEINTPTQYVNDNMHFFKDTYSNISEILSLNLQLLESNNKPDEEFVKKLKDKLVEYDVKYLQDEIPLAIDQSLEGLGHISRIVKSMKSFAHPAVEQKVFTDINKSLQDTITITKNEWKYVATIETNFDEKNSQVYCYPAEIHQVFLNIIINAAHAIDDAIKNGKYKKGKINISTKMQENFFEIIISDNATGIPEEITDKIFDPFFTTKEVGKGTGQGLAISYSIIAKKHKGKLLVNSTPKEGSDFIIHLPNDTSNNKEHINE